MADRPAHPSVGNPALPRWWPWVVSTLALALVLTSALLLPGLAWRRITAPDPGAVPLVRFSEGYLAEARGRLRVEIPEVYELLQVILLIGSAAPDLPVGSEGYRDQVLARFGRLREHPAVAKVREAVRSDPDALRYAALYRFAGDELLLGPCSAVPRHVNDFVGQNRALLEGFARESGYRQFYREHEALYQGMVADYQRRVDGVGIWRWLESQYPERYAAIRVLLSPLAEAALPALTLRDGAAGYQELILFAGPLPPSAESFPVADAMAAARLFAAMGQPYVSPVTDRHRSRVTRVMGDLKAWRRRADSGTAPDRTFTAYMAGATFLLWAREAYPPTTFIQVRESQISQMESQGYLRFRFFSECIFRLYDQRRSDQTLADLFGAILDEIRAIEALLAFVGTFWACT